MQYIYRYLCTCTCMCMCICYMLYVLCYMLYDVICFILYVICDMWYVYVYVIVCVCVYVCVCVSMYVCMYTYNIYIYINFRRNKVYASWKLDRTSISVNRGSHFQVHFVWQVWDGQLSPAFKSIRLNAFWGWKFDRGTTKLHARILRGKGMQKKKPNMFTGGSSTSATFVLPVYIHTWLNNWALTLSIHQIHDMHVHVHAHRFPTY